MKAGFLKLTLISSINIHIDMGGYWANGKLISLDTRFGDHNSDHLLSKYCGFSLVPGDLYAIWIILLLSIIYHEASRNVVLI